MITFSKFVLSNGLHVLVHSDTNTPLAVVNILYKVGARDEHPDKTGFAHLFEHLMFEGSKHAPVFDEPLQRAGGESNAFTNNDFTNYYDILPADNLEVALWLESDRMKYLNINEHSLEVQRKVVCEEFKEHYLNQPYGDIWHRLSSLAYTTHPYRWPTIGKELSHIESATLDEVRQFFHTYYRPNNAILIMAGNIEVDYARELAEKWFGDIEPHSFPERTYPREPLQEEPRYLELEADVPLDAIVKAYHMGKRDSKNYYVMDFVSDLFSNGHSSRLYQGLVKGKKIFSEIECYVTGTLDEGLIVIEGKIHKGIKMKEAEAAIDEELYKLQNEKVVLYELQKIKNRLEANWTLSEVHLLSRAMNLAYYEMLGDATRINTEINEYLNITAEDIMHESRQVFTSKNCSTIYYYAKN